MVELPVTLRRLDHLAEHLSRDAGVQAVLGLGSAGVETSSTSSSPWQAPATAISAGDGLPRALSATNQIRSTVRTKSTSGLIRVNGSPARQNNSSRP